MTEAGGIAVAFHFGEGMGHASEAQLVQLGHCRVFQHSWVLLVTVSGAPDVGVKDRRALRGFAHGNLVKPRLEDRFDAGVIAGLDFQCAQCRCLQADSDKALGQADYSEAGPISLLGM